MWSALLLALSLSAGCTFGPRQLKDGRLAYNEAMRASDDQELLLNIVRLRYLDSLEFLATNSISAQLSFSVAVGGRVGQEADADTTLGLGEVAWSNRPTFTFTPQRGVDFAKTMVTSVPLDLLVALSSSEWDVAVLFRLLVQNVNGLRNMSGIISDEFVELAKLLSQLQVRNELYFGSVERRDVLSDPIPVPQVSGADLIQAAKEGFRFEHNGSRNAFVLTASRKQLALHVPLDAGERPRLIELLHLDVNNSPFLMVEPGTPTDYDTVGTDRITVDTRSVLDAIAYLAGGVDVPASHTAEGWALPEWPVAGAKSKGLPGFFKVRTSERRPNSSLAVQHRSQWFYLAEDDLVSRATFLALAELLRLAISPGEGQAPVLTLPVGGG